MRLFTLILACSCCILSVGQNAVISNNASITINENTNISVTGFVQKENGQSFGNGELIINNSLINNNWEGLFGEWLMNFSAVQNQNIIDGNSPLVIEKLLMNNTNGLILEQSVKINNEMLLVNGIIKSNNENHIVEFDENGSLGTFSETSFVDGKVKAKPNVSFTYPLGNQNELAQIEIKNVYQNVSALFKKESHGQFPFSDGTVTNISEDRFWQITGENDPNNGMIKFYWNSELAQEINFEKLTVVQWDGIKWVRMNVIEKGGSRENGYIVINGVSTLGLFTFAESVFDQFNNQVLDIIPVLQSENKDGHYKVKTDKLSFYFEEDYYVANNAFLEFNIYNSSRQIVYSNLEEQINYKQGVNKIELSCLTNKLNGTPGDYYLLEVINAKGENLYLRFQNNTQTSDCNLLDDFNSILFTN